MTRKRAHIKYGALCLVQLPKALSKVTPSDQSAPDDASGIFPYPANGGTREEYIQREADGAKCHVNLHQMRMIIIKIIAPNGAYWRSIALKLIFRAALRYFSDSERNELDKWDIPVDK